MPPAVTFGLCKSLSTRISCFADRSKLHKKKIFIDLFQFSFSVFLLFGFVYTLMFNITKCVVLLVWFAYVCSCFYFSVFFSHGVANKTILWFKNVKASIMLVVLSLCTQCDGKMKRKAKLKENDRSVLCTI